LKRPPYGAQPTGKCGPAPKRRGRRLVPLQETCANPCNLRIDIPSLRSRRLCERLSSGGIRSHPTIFSSGGMRCRPTTKKTIFWRDTIPPYDLLFRRDTMPPCTGGAVLVRGAGARTRFPYRKRICRTRFRRAEKPWDRHGFGEKRGNSSRSRSFLPARREIFNRTIPSPFCCSAKRSVWMSPAGTPSSRRAVVTLSIMTGGPQRKTRRDSSSSLKTCGAGRLVTRPLEVRLVFSEGAWAAISPFRTPRASPASSVSTASLREASSRRARATNRRRAPCPIA